MSQTPPTWISPNEDWQAFIVDSSGPCERSIRFPGFALDVSGTDSQAAKVLLAAFDHLPATAVDFAGPRYHWHIADIPQTSGPSLNLPDPSRFGDVTFPGGHIGYVERRGPAITAFDIAQKRVLTNVLTGQNLVSDSSAKPIMRALMIIAESQGWYLAHGALLGREGNGVFVVGSGGAGKSTIAAACVEAGLDYVGDDFVFFQKQGEAWIGRSLFSTLMLFEEQAAKFEKLSRIQPVENISNRRKNHIPIRRSDGFAPVESLRIRALLHPEIIKTPNSALVPTAKLGVLRALLGHSIVASPLRSGAQSQELFELASALPAYRFQSGSDFSDIPMPIERWLKEQAFDEQD